MFVTHTERPCVPRFPAAAWHPATIASLTSWHNPLVTCTVGGAMIGLSSNFDELLAQAVSLGSD